MKREGKENKTNEKKMNEMQKNAKCKKRKCKENAKCKKMKCKENAKKGYMKKEKPKKGLIHSPLPPHKKIVTEKKRNCLVTPKSFPYVTNLKAHQLTHFGSSAPIPM